MCLEDKQDWMDFVDAVKDGLEQSTEEDSLDSGKLDEEEQ